MGSDWIQWVKGLSKRREVIAVATRLNLDRRIVACLCMEFWEWADDETENGFVAGTTPEFVDGLCGQQGFFAALAEQKWVRTTSAGITLLNWDRHNGESSKLRARNRRNQDRSRDLRKAVTGPSPPTNDVLSVLPLGLDLPVFREAWKTWFEYRAQARLKAWRPATVALKLTELERMGVERAVAAIHHSIANGYQGIFEPRGGTHGQRKQPGAGANQRRSEKAGREYDEGGLKLPLTG